MTADPLSIADGRYTAVVDRFEQRDGEGDEQSGDDERGENERNEDGVLAVLLLESGEEVVAERAVPRWRLPADARHPDAVLEVGLRNGFVVSLDFDPDATERRTSAAQDRFDRLAERPDEKSDE